MGEWVMGLGQQGGVVHGIGPVVGKEKGIQTGLAEGFWPKKVLEISMVYSFSCLIQI
jgi:hypothetical protein